MADINEQRLSSLHQTVPSPSGSAPSEEPQSEVLQRLSALRSAASTRSSNQSSHVPNGNIARWTSAEVEEWAAVHVSQEVSDIFREHEVDGQKLVKEIDVDTLLAMGIGKEACEVVLSHI